MRKVRKSRGFWIVLGLVALLIVAGVSYKLIRTKDVIVIDDRGMVPGTFCNESNRNVDYCIELYQPVCGWFDSSIKCLKYPCASTYGNSCEACRDSKVEYWTDGECPK